MKAVQFWYDKGGCANCLTDDGQFWIMNFTPGNAGPDPNSSKPTLAWEPSILNSATFAVPAVITPPPSSAAPGSVVVQISETTT